MGGIPAKLRIAADAAHKTETRWVAQDGSGTQYPWELPAGVAMTFDDLVRWIGQVGGDGGYPVRVTQLQIHPERALCYATVWELGDMPGAPASADSSRAGWTRLVPKKGIDTGMTGANAFERLVLLVAERPEVIASAGSKLAEALTPVIDTTFSPIVEVIVERTSKRTCDDVRRVVREEVRETVRQEIRALIAETFADADPDAIEPDGPVAALPEPELEQEPEPKKPEVRRVATCVNCDHTWAWLALDAKTRASIDARNSGAIAACISCPKCSGCNIQLAPLALPAPAPAPQEGEADGRHA